MKHILFTILVVFSFSVKADDFKAHFINVGQADATLLEFSKGTVMIDAGGELHNIKSSRTSLGNYLTTFYQRRTDLKKTIDVLIITHNHYDHISLITDLSKNYTIKRIITSKFKLTKELKKAAKNEKIQLEFMDYRFMDSLMLKGYEVDLKNLVTAGTTIPKLTLYSGEISVKVKHTVNGHTFPPSNFSNPNNNSIVSKLVYGKTSMLFTGDLEHEGIEYLTAKYHNNLSLFDVDFYHVGHHGAENGTTKELLEIMTPKIALISAGDSTNRNGGSAWDHGHPRKSTLELLNTQASLANRNQPIKVHAYPSQEVAPAIIDLKKEVYCTCWTGTIVMLVDSNGKYTKQ
ncbi:MBL fold metallo-hydrolase [Fluviicola sp.]|uniref:ComEC/Rec2 family competence protein n=1 Tax=Fluviicola sp. TaxID=1917219 RepID=UPI0031DB3F15